MPSHPAQKAAAAVVVEYVLGRRWIFPSPRLHSDRPPTVQASVKFAFERILATACSVVLPDNCRVCEAPLQSASRIPVCATCLNSSRPYCAEYQCVCCHTAFLTPHPLDERGQCGLCRRGLSGFDAAYSFGFYEGTLRKLIQLLKYGKVASLARPLGQLLADAVPRDRSFDVIVPMPMHWRRRWSRGFNQAALLGSVLSRRLHLPVSSALRRQKFTPPLAGMTANQRRSSIAGAFKISRPDEVRGKRILIVDDVFTTGATAGACARVLKSAGAAHVSIITVARAERAYVSTASMPIRDTYSTPLFGSVLNAQSRPIA